MVNAQISLPAQCATNLTLSAMQQAMSLIDSVDLSMVKLKIMDKEEGQGWDEEYADYVESRYRRYLCMILLSGGKGSVVPTKEIDLFWHQHILDTRAYAADCDRVFGEFLHHFPYFGMRGEDDARNLESAFEETKATYFRLFGEEYCHSEAVKCHKCSSPTCHKCANNPNCSDTIKCTRCRSN
jgi:hypothetical protein